MLKVGQLGKPFVTLHIDIWKAVAVGLLPDFTWDHSTTTSGGPVIKLIVAFEDNKPDDVAELTRQPVTYITVAEEEEENECVLIGHLREESNVAVAVSGCPGSDTFEVSS